MRTETFTDSRGRKQTWHRGGLVGVNRCLSRLRAFYSWAVKADYVTATPFKKGTETIIEMFSEAKRERRLQPAHGGQPGEQERIFTRGQPTPAGADRRCPGDRLSRRASCVAAVAAGPLGSERDPPSGEEDEGASGVVISRCRRRLQGDARDASAGSGRATNTRRTRMCSGT